MLSEISWVQNGHKPNYSFGGGGMQHWGAWAICTGLDVHAWFIDGRRPSALKPRRLCIECPVRWLCLEEGITEEFGIWGGLILHDRNQVFKLRSRGQDDTQFIWELDQKTIQMYDQVYGWDMDRLKEELRKPESPPEDEPIDFVRNRYRRLKRIK